MRYTSPQVYSKISIGVSPCVAQYEQAVLLFTPQHCPGEPSETLVLPEKAPVCFKDENPPFPGFVLNTYTCLENPGETYNIIVVDAVPGEGSGCAGDNIYETTLRFEPSPLPLCTVTSMIEPEQSPDDKCLD